jgi:hypothetical protein
LALIEAMDILVTKATCREYGVCAQNEKRFHYFVLLTIGELALSVMYNCIRSSEKKDPVTTKCTTPLCMAQIAVDEAHGTVTNSVQKNMQSIVQHDGRNGWAENRVL